MRASHNWTLLFWPNVTQILTKLNNHVRIVTTIILIVFKTRNRHMWPEIMNRCPQLKNHFTPILNLSFLTCDLSLGQSVNQLVTHYSLVFISNQFHSFSIHSFLARSCWPNRFSFPVLSTSHSTFIRFFPKLIRTSGFQLSHFKTESLQKNNRKYPLHWRGSIACLAVFLAHVRFIRGLTRFLDCTMNNEVGRNDSWGLCYNYFKSALTYFITILPN